MNPTNLKMKDKIYPLDTKDKHLNEKIYEA